MKSSFVLATADSRLQADIIVIRLRRAGINLDRVSALFSRQFTPNSFFLSRGTPCVLRSPTGRETSVVVGPLKRYFGRAREVEAVPGVLRELGLSPREATQLGFALWLGRAVICVSTKNQDEEAIAWHIFKHSWAEDIAVSGPSAVQPKEASSSVTLIPAVAA